MRPMRGPPQALGTLDRCRHAWCGSVCFVATRAPRSQGKVSRPALRTVRDLALE